MMKCTKCKKEFSPNTGFYNRPSGVLCVKCGEVKSPNMIEMVMFVNKIANMELGCAPSVGLMYKLIEEARCLLNK